MDLLGSGVDVVARGMDAATKRHEIVAGNIANVNTPNYRARELRFDEAFKTALRSGKLREALAVTPEVVESESARVKADGNSVHLEEQFATMQKNSLLFGTYGALLRGKIQQTRYAIDGTV